MRNVAMWCDTHSVSLNVNSNDSLVIQTSPQTTNGLVVGTSSEGWVRGPAATVLTMADGDGEKMIGVDWAM
jgi:hypothetical protein